MNLHRYLLRGKEKAPRDAASPGTAAPGDVSPSLTAPPVLAPGGPSPIGYVYQQLQAVASATMPAAGGTMTGTLTVAAATPLILAPPSNAVKATFADTTPAGGSGWTIDKPDKTNIRSHGVGWLVGGQPVWGMGMDVATNNTGNGGTGNADFVPVFDNTGGYDDTGARVFPGIDVFRFTPAESSTTAKCTTWQLAGQGAGRNVSGFFGQIVAGINLGGIEVSANIGTGRDHLLFTQRAATHKRAVLNLDQQWQVGCDLAAANTPDFQVYDAAHAQTRLFIPSVTGATGKVGVNTNNPLAALHVLGAGAIDTPVPLVTAGYSQDLTNRSINLEQIGSLSTVKQYVWLNGTLGSTSTTALPTATSGVLASGLESTDTGLALIAAPLGTNQAINRPIQIASHAIGLFDTTPVGKQTVAGSKAANAALTSLIAALVAYGLITDTTT